MSLTELSYYFRKMAPFAILSVIVVFILYYSIQLVVLLVQLNKPPEAAPGLAIDTIFNQITPPEIRESTPSANYTFTLDTIEGVPVTEAETAKVFYLPEANATLGFRENIYLMAKTLGFDTELTKYRLQGSSAVFADNQQKLTIDIKNYNFDYEYNQLSQEADRLADARIPSEGQILNAARDVLKNVGRYPEEIARGKTNIIYLAFNPETEQLQVVNSPDLANMVEVDFYRPNIGEIPVVAPRYFNSQNYVIMLFDSKGYKVIRSKIRFFEASTAQVGVYPLKSGDDAWRELNEGKGMVVSAPEGATNISIKRMFLGYLDPDIYQSYLQPVYVFLGENFAAYVPAVSNEWMTVASDEAAISEEAMPIIEDTAGDPNVTDSADLEASKEAAPEYVSTDDEESDSAQSREAYIQKAEANIPYNADRRARDNKREKDVITIETLLKQYLDDNNSFPAGKCTPETPCRSIRFLTKNADDTCKATNWLGFDFCKYATSIPVEPLNRQRATCVNGQQEKEGCGMEYRVVLDGALYEINVRMENNPLSGADGGNSDEWYEVFNGPSDLLSE